MLFGLGPRHRFYVGSLLDIWILKEVMLDRQYDFGDRPRSDWVVVDVGAGIGDFDVLIGPHVATVFAFEVDEERFRMAQLNVGLNGGTNVELVRQEVANLDDLFRHWGIERCDLLKIDCEGCEYRIFASSSNETLRRIERIVAEVHFFDDKMKGEYVALKQRLIQRGFTLEERLNPVHRTLGFLYACR
jgi:SAM-dependent methyltransferase